MPTWSDVQVFVRERYRLQKDEPQHFVMVWQLPEPDAKAAAATAAPLGAPPVTQTLHCQHLLGGAPGQEWLLLRSEVCGERGMSPTAALQHSARLILGGLVLSGNQYVLRYTLPLRSLDWQDFEQALQYLTREAGSLRQRVGHQTGTHPRNPFTPNITD